MAEEVHRHASKKLSGTADNTKKKRSTRRPILSEKVFIEAHLELDNRLELYPSRGGRNKIDIPNTVADQLRPGVIGELYANNLGSRISFVQAMKDITRPILVNETRPIHWITMASEAHTLDFEEACAFNPVRLQSWVRSLLPGVNFIGMVDIGIYPVPHATQSQIKASFHWHGLGWGPSPEEVSALGDHINARYRPYLIRRPAFHARHVAPDWANKLVYYMGKHPLKSSRFVQKLEWVDFDTGEIRERGDDRHYEERITSGRAVRVATILQPHRLNNLIFAAGEGVPLRKQIIARAIARAEIEWRRLPVQMRH
ncbi:hypothetical protein [Devosia sp. UYZn731]|uniref:hypothetical protein n=1 Tax=Devosia sp. UYZn731 TaxID=3156345 RepID=UPI00339885A9